MKRMECEYEVVLYYPNGTQQVLRCRRSWPFDIVYRRLLQTVCREFNLRQGCPILLKDKEGHRIRNSFEFSSTLKRTTLEPACYYCYFDPLDVNPEDVSRANNAVPSEESKYNVLSSSLQEMLALVQGNMWETHVPSDLLRQGLLDQAQALEAELSYLQTFLRSVPSISSEKVQEELVQDRNVVMEESCYEPLGTWLTESRAQDEQTPLLSVPEAPPRMAVPFKTKWPSSSFSVLWTRDMSIQCTSIATESGNPLLESSVTVLPAILQKRLRPKLLSEGATKKHSSTNTAPPVPPKAAPLTMSPYLGLCLPPAIASKPSFLSSSLSHPTPLLRQIQQELYQRDLKKQATLFVENVLGTALAALATETEVITKSQSIVSALGSENSFEDFEFL